MKRLHGFVVRPVKSTGDKLIRADTYATQINMGNVHTALRGKVWDDYVNELKYFPDGANDDQVDASSGAYTLLTNKGVRIGVIK